MRQLSISKSITNRDEISLEKYLNEISREPMISAEEEVQLSHLIKRGNKEALDKLTRANLRFVVSVAKQYQHQGLALSDLVNEGNIGLIKAAENFDSSKGFKFISYAVWWIRQCIIQALAEKARMVRLPINKVGLSNRLSKTASKLEQQLERLPSEEELASHLELDPMLVAEGLSYKNQCVSLDSPFSDEEESTLLDTIENSNAPFADNAIRHTKSLQKEIRRCLSILNSQQRLTICYLFGLGVDRALTLDEIGEKLDISRERVRQVKNSALLKLQSSKNSEQLRNYLGV